MKSSISVFFACAATASAQGYLPANASDARIQIVRYLPDQPITLHTVLGSGVVILIGNAERIQTIRLTDPTAYQVTVMPQGDGVVLRQTRPLSYSAMSFDTSARRYEFALTSGAGAAAPYVVRFDYTTQNIDAEPQASAPRDISRLTPYKLSGNKELRPQFIGDDGVHTYIQWGSGQSVPAVFAIDRLGREEMVDGYMRNGTFTIDRVHDKLVFRIDKAAMVARRPPPRIKKP